jgi:hypothetical protein
MLVGPYFLVGLPGDVAGGDQDAELPLSEWSWFSGVGGG